MLERAVSPRVVERADQLVGVPPLPQGEHAARVVAGRAWQRLLQRGQEGRGPLIHPREGNSQLVEVGPAIREAGTVPIED